MAVFSTTIYTMLDCFVCHFQAAADAAEAEAKRLKAEAAEAEARRLEAEANVAKLQAQREKEEGEAHKKVPVLFRLSHPE